MNKEDRKEIAKELERVYGIVFFDSVSAYKKVERRELHDIFVKALWELDSLDREIVLGCCLYDRSSSEIGRELGLDVSASSIRLRKKMAFKKIRKSLWQYGVGADYLRAG